MDENSIETSPSLSSLVKDLAQKVILSFIKELPKHGKVDLVIESDLISSLDLVCGVSLLKEGGVDKIFKLEPGSGTPGANKTCCFLTRGSVQTIKTIVELVSADETSTTKNDVTYGLLCLPRLTSVCEKILEEGGVFGKLIVLDCPLHLFPLEHDILSLQRNDTFVDLFLYHDQTCLYDVASAILHLEQLTGPIRNVVGQGKYSKYAIHLLECRLKEEPSSKHDTSQPLVTDLLIIDRDVDMVSLLLSQLNYEGVLDESYGIDCGKVFLPPSVIPPNGVKHHLTDSGLYGQIRDSHLSSSFLRLKDIGSQLKELSDSRQDMDLSAMKDFLEKDFKNVQSMYKSFSLHVTTCEAIMKEKKDSNFSRQLQVERNIVAGDDLKDAMTFIEDFIIRQVDPMSSLRLMSLLSITSDGMSSRSYRNFSKLFCQSFGHEHISTLFNLSKLQLFYEQTTSAHIIDVATATSTSTKKQTAKFREIVKRLNLIPKVPEGTSYDVKKPSDEAFVFGGAFIPVICPLLDQFIMSEGQSISDSQRLLSGGICRTFKRPSVPDRKGSDRVIGVFFVGGVTFAEVSALRFWAKRKSVKILIMTTSIVNGKTVMSSLMTK